MASTQEIDVDTAESVWTVVTRTSTYLLDFDE